MRRARLGAIALLASAVALAGCSVASVTLDLPDVSIQACELTNDFNNDTVEVALFLPIIGTVVISVTGDVHLRDGATGELFTLVFGLHFFDGDPDNDSPKIVHPTEATFTAKQHDVPGGFLGMASGASTGVIESGAGEPEEFTITWLVADGTGPLWYLFVDRCETGA